MLYRRILLKHINGFFYNKLHWQITSRNRNPETAHYLKTKVLTIMKD